VTYVTTRRQTNSPTAKLIKSLQRTHMNPLMAWKSMIFYPVIPPSLLCIKYLNKSHWTRQLSSKQHF